MIEVADSSGLESHQEQHQRFILADSSGEDQEMKAPKKRAETWVQEETLSLINFRREMDGLFNTSKSNKHLWEEISSKMRDKGFDRSPTMCTDKWRNLLKEFKKTKYQDQAISPKLTYYKELDELIKGRNKNVSPKTSVHSKDDTFFQFNEKGLSDASIPFDSVEGDRTFNLERSSDHESHPLAITNDADVAGNGVPPWNWRDTPGNGDSNTSYGGRVITVKWGDLTRRIGIDGDAAAIKEAIKSVFGLRTKRAFWLEDEDEVVRSFDRNMPLGTYTLHLDAGITIKICYYDESGRIPVRTEEKTLYNEDAFNELLGRYGWNYLKELSGFRTVDSLEELCPGVMYHGV